MSDEIKGPAQKSPRSVGESMPDKMSKTGSAGIDRRRIILSTLKAVPVVTTLGVTAGKAQADPKGSPGASGNSSIKATKVKK